MQLLNFLRTTRAGFSSYEALGRSAIRAPSPHNHLSDQRLHPFFLVLLSLLVSKALIAKDKKKNTDLEKKNYF